MEECNFDFTCNTVFRFLSVQKSGQHQIADKHNSQCETQHFNYNIRIKQDQMSKQSIKGMNFMQIYQIQRRHNHHKSQLKKIMTKNMQNTVKQQSAKQKNILVNYKKRYLRSEYQRTKNSLDQINKANQKLHQTIQNITNRQKKFISLRSPQQQRAISSYRSVAKINNRKSLGKIERENQILIEKILLTKSSLQKSRMEKDYAENRKSQKKLQKFNTTNRKRLISALKKMNITPNICLPQAIRLKTIQ